MRTILGPTITSGGERGLKSNKEVEDELEGEINMKYIKLQRLK